MRKKITAVTESLFEYNVRLFASRERALLRRMARAANRAGIPLIMISEEQAKFLRVLLRAIGARRVLDVGTLFGYSAVVMAQALPPDGRVVSLESNPEHAEVARANVSSLGLDAKVEVRVSQALEAMKRMPDGSFDLVLIDADKPGYVNYLRESVRLVRDGGIIAADNAYAFGLVARQDLPAGHPDDQSVRAIRKFNRALAARRDVESVIVPVGDGLALGVVCR